jgi:hypothetical protein
MMKKFVKSGVVSLERVKHILLFTDGLIPPKKDPKAKDNFDEFVQTFLKEGLEAVKNKIRTKEKTDPSCREYPRYKQHDDIAAIAVILDKG